MGCDSFALLKSNYTHLVYVCQSQISHTHMYLMEICAYSTFVQWTYKPQKNLKVANEAVLYHSTGHLAKDNTREQARIKKLYYIKRMSIQARM